MMRDEMLLARAAGALREIGREEAEDAARTRARVVRRVRLRRASRQLGLVLTALALVLVGAPGAWALATGRAPAWAEPILRVLVPDARSEAAPVAAPRRSRALVAVAAPDAVPRAGADTVPGADADAVADAAADTGADADADADAVADTDTDTDTASDAVPGAGADTHTVTDTAPVPAPRAARHSSARVVHSAPDVDALYLEAHELHFVARDPVRALAAWDRYLAAAPDGRFGLEARYNRALDLVRLGRLPAARSALAPFASGELDGYRRREAEALLTALRSEP